MGSDHKSFRLSKHGDGFSVGELITVLVIIAILVVIAVPNMREACCRSNVSRVRADLRTMTATIEAYRADYQSLPFATRFAETPDLLWPGGGASNLTTPVAYTDVYLESPFDIVKLYDGGDQNRSRPYAIDLIGAAWESSGPFEMPDPSSGAREHHFHLAKATIRVPEDLPALRGGVESGTEWAHTFQGDRPPLGEAEQLVEVDDGGVLPADYVLWSIGRTEKLPADKPQISRFNINQHYDPTNGTISPGFIARFHQQPSMRTENPK